MEQFNTVPAFLIAFFISYYFHGVGITLGYHRILSHRSLKVPKLIEYFWVAGGYLAFEGSPIFWVTTHRLHHRYSDHEGDPHSPLDGLWHAFISWMWNPKVIISKEESKMIGPDLYRDPVYNFLHCNHTQWDGWLCLAIGVGFRLALFMLFGPVVMVANILGAGMAFLGPLLVNTVSHIRRFGYETYPCGDDSRNVWFVALLAFGEGWHNNHHAFPQSARHGLKPLELDVTWMTISLLKMLGMAKEIRLPKTVSKLVVPEDVQPVGTIRR